MNRHQWKGEQKSFEQYQRELLDSPAYEQHEAAKARRNLAAEQAERFMPAEHEEEATSKEEAQQAAEISERAYQTGYRFADRRKAAKLLADTMKYRIVLGDEFERYLRACTGWRQKDEIPPQEPEPCDQHAMGCDEQ